MNIEKAIIAVDGSSEGPVFHVVSEPTRVGEISTEKRPLAIRRTSERPWVSIVLLTVTIAAAAIPRFNHIGKSLWTSEAWVVNSALSASLRQIFHYEGWLQTTPPLFLLTVRGAVRVFGLSTFTLRAVPFVLSLLSLLFLALLSRKIVRTPFAVLTTTLLALSPPAVVFAKEVKQYSGDLATTCCLLFLSWIYLRSPNRGNYALLLSGLAIGLFLSYPAVCFVPLALWVVFAARPFSARGLDHLRSIAPRLAGIGLLAALISASNYWLFIRPNRAPQLTQFWAEGYPTFSGLRSTLYFYAQYFMGMGISFYIPSESKEVAREVLSAAGHAPILALAMAGVAALWIAAPVLWRNKRYKNGLLLCFLPVLTLGGINLVRLYPVSGRRLTLFIFPCIALATTVILQAVWDRLAIPQKLDQSGRLGLFLSLSLILIIFVVGTHADNWANYPPEDEDTAALFRDLKSHAGPDDIVYIHASLIEPAQLYFRMLKWAPRHMYLGQTGFPCCTRKVEPELSDAESERAYVAADLQKGGVEWSEYKHAWFLFTARKQHWGTINRDEREIIARYLEQRGCEKELRKSFTNVELLEFTCARANGSSKEKIGDASSGQATDAIPD